MPTAAYFKGNLQNVVLDCPTEKELLEISNHFMSQNEGFQFSISMTKAKWENF